MRIIFFIYFISRISIAIKTRKKYRDFSNSIFERYSQFICAICLLIGIILSFENWNLDIRVEIIISLLILGVWIYFDIMASKIYKKIEESNVKRFK